MRQIQDVHVRATEPLIAPHLLKNEMPVDEGIARTVVEARETIREILAGRDRRMLCIVGPCSIHDPDAAIDYAHRLAKLKDETADRLYIVMRVYFEKPRTTVGWKGLINDPHMDDSCDMREGLRIARRLLLDINRLGLAAGTELLDPITPQYIADLIAWAAIGARTTESQTHREMASGLSMPVGFKNTTEEICRLRSTPFNRRAARILSSASRKRECPPLFAPREIPILTSCCAAAASRTSTRAASKNAAGCSRTPPWSRA